MVEKSEILKAELERDIAEQRAELRQIAAGLGGFSEAVADAPHRPGLGRIASANHARHP
jgi:hypothetical protein